MSNNSVTLEAVESCMALRRKRGLTFPPPIEEQFETDTRVRRCQRLASGIVVTTLIYNLFLFADWLLVPDVFWLAVTLHIYITPCMLAAAWFILKGPGPIIRECLVASLPLLIAIQIEVCFASTASPLSAHYQYVLVSTILHANVSLHRLVFRFACAVSAAIILCHATVVLLADVLPSSIAAMILVILAVCAYMTLVANYQLERDVRRAYLYSLRDRLRHASAEEASRRDALTGLGNRHHLHAELETLWSSTAANVSPVSIVLIDIDHFKRLNDRYGHVAGDLCLKRVAAILTAELRGVRDSAVRYGGEEFLLLLPHMHLVDGVRIAERARRAIEKACIPNEGADAAGVVTASFGVASSAITDLTAIELIAAADSALYAAKRKGRNQVWPPLATTVDASPAAVTSIPSLRILKLP